MTGTAGDCTSASCSELIRRSSYPNAAIRTNCSASIIRRTLVCPRRSRAKLRSISISLAQLLLLIPLFYFVRRLTDDPRRVPWLVAATAVFAYPPLYISFQLGQVSVLLLVCLLGFACNLAGG